MTQPATKKEELKVRRGRVDSVDLYEVKEHELDILEKGEQADVFFNFAIFLLSIAFSALGAFVTATFKKPIYETLFLIIIVVGTLGGLFLIFLWRKNRQGIKQIVKTIKGRIPPESVEFEDQAIVPDDGPVTTETTLPPNG